MKINVNSWQIWLIRSTYAIKSYELGNTSWKNKLPQDGCDYFKKLIFSILAFPFVYLCHIVNKLKGECEMSGFMGFSLNFIGFILSGGVLNQFGELWPLAEFLPSDNYLRWFILYLSSPISLLIAFAAVLIVIWICVGIVWLLERAQKLFKKQKNKINSNEENESSQLKILYKSIKDKYCPVIEYVDSPNSNSSSWQQQTK